MTRIANHVPQTEGQPLQADVRQQLEAEMGADFSGVRVHTDVRAVAAARSVDARAFTVGQDIYFNAGQYLPVSTQGRFLLAHELAHVVQQQASHQLTNGQ